MSKSALNRLLDKAYLGSRSMSFAAPKVVLYGRGAAQRLPEHLNEVAKSRVFIITDRNLIDAGVGADLVTKFQSEGAPEVLGRKPGEPKASEIDDLAEAARRYRPSAIVAIGGGATMDSAKIVRVLVEHGGSVADYEGHDRVPWASTIPFVAVATTAGTGSETGAGAVYTDEKTGVKTVVSSSHMLADVAVVDPELTISVPPGTTAATGIDALAQGIGAYLTPLRHPITDAVALDAIRLLSGYLVRAFEKGDDVEARAAVAYGSLLSGLAMNSAEAIADQFFDEVIGPRYNVPHGIVSGILVPYVMQFNRTVSSSRIARIGEAILPAPAATEEERVDQVIERMSELVEELRLPSLQAIGVKEADLAELAEQVAGHYGVEMGLNPRHVTEADARAILQAAWQGEDPLGRTA